MREFMVFELIFGVPMKNVSRVTTTYSYTFGIGGGRCNASFV